MNIKSTGYSDVSTRRIISAVTGFSGGVILLICVIFICYRKRKNKNLTKTIISTKIEVNKFIDGNVDLPALKEFERLKDQERLRNHFTTIQDDFSKNATGKSMDQVLTYSHSKVKTINSRNIENSINGSWVMLPEDEGHYDSISIFPYLPTSRLGLIVMNSQYGSKSEDVMQMIYENDVSVALNFSRTDNHSSMMNSFASPFAVKISKVVKKLKSRDVVEKKLIREEWDLSVERLQTKRLIQFELQEFTIQSSNAINRILRAITYIRKEMTINQQQMIMLVQDENEGVSEAAIFVALLILLEKLDESSMSLDKNLEDSPAVVDIFETVNKLRSRRMQMVQTFDEYQFLYHSLTMYAKNKTSFDKLLMSKKVASSHSNVGNFEIKTSKGEVDDSYHLQPIVAQRALRKVKHSDNTYEKRTVLPKKKSESQASAKYENDTFETASYANENIEEEYVTYYMYN